MRTVAIILCLLPNVLMAADDPSVINQTQGFEQSDCRSTFEQACINNKCLTSEERNCQSNCRDQADAYVRAGRCPSR